MNPCSIGVSGDLYIGGECLSLGYVNEPSLTAEKYVPDPYGNAPGARLYKTGDLARYWEDGTIEFLGRLDHQVKVRGYRIELGEIEATLVRYPGIRETVVLAREDNPGEKRLIAYVIPERQETIPVITELRRFVEEQLPSYMVPAAFVILDAIPLTANGKVDRRALPVPERRRPKLEGGVVASQTPIEDTLTRFWAEALRLEEVGIHDNFFELGGDSLLATQLVARLRDALRVELPLQDFFHAPTVAVLAERVEAALGKGEQLALPPIRPVPREETLPLSFSQERVWFLQRLDPANLAYNFQATLRFTGEFDVAALERSLSEIVRRHEILRTTFPLVDGRPLQIIHYPWSVQVLLIDLQDVPKSMREAEAQRLIDGEVRKRFDLDQLPLLRWILLRFNAREHVLLHVEHHLIHDGWSFNVFLGELMTLYKAFSARQSSPLPELPVQFADFAHWQRRWMEGEAAEAQLAYWKEKLSGSLPLLKLPIDHPRPLEQTFRGAVHRAELSADLYESLQALSHREGATLFMTMASALFVLLQRYSAQQDISIGAGIANRRHRETEAMIGMVINTVVLRTDLSGDPTFREVLQRVRQVTLGAYAHQDMPFDKVVEAVQPQRNPSYNPLFQVIFGFHDAPLPDLRLPGLEVRLREGLSNGSAKFDLNIIAIPPSEYRDGQSSSSALVGMTFIWEYNTDLFEATTIVRMANHFRMLLQAIATAPDQHVSDLPILTEEERHQLQGEWSGITHAYPRKVGISRLFEDQVERTPDAIAVCYEGDQLTYRELNRQANKLAHHLQRLNVGPETLVGICMERSLELVVGLLGIIKTGGAYVPLDPTHPKERLAFLLADARPSVLLTQESLLERLPSQEARVLCVDALGAVIRQESEVNPIGVTTGESLAYVMYTSGSTGRPKAIAVPHRAIARLVLNTNYLQVKSTDSVAQASNASFDAATFEIWGALLNGARLVGVAKEVMLSPEAFVAHMQEQEITVLFLTTALFNQLAQAVPGAFRSVRHLLFGGEMVDPHSVRKVLKEGPPERLLHVYGPTETTTFATWHLVQEVADGAVNLPIGQPIASTEVYLLDAHRQLVPVGVPGELYIGGDGVAHGYLRRPDLTAERFVPHPFSKDLGARLYRTGDLARYLPTGDIEFLGRLDDQVKIHGFRIEPGEIEAVLVGHPAVREAVVLAQEGSPGNKQLVAYVVLAKEGSPAISVLRQFLKAWLPEYMLPAAIIPLEELPLNANGKVDRHALPDPRYFRPERDDTYVAPRTEIEQTVAGIWQEVLGVGHIGVHDNFFDVGGSSLRMIQVHSRLREVLPRELAMVDLFRYPTIHSFAEHLSAGLAVPPALEQGRGRAEIRRAAMGRHRASRQR